MKKFETLKAGISDGKTRGLIVNRPVWEDQELFASNFLAILNNGISEVKPHLFPLSYLTKPIRVEGYNDGKEFVPITHLFSAENFIKYPLVNHSTFNGYVDDIWLENEKGEVLDMNLGKTEWNLLDQWHFLLVHLDASDYIDASQSKVYKPK